MKNDEKMKDSNTQQAESKPSLMTQLYSRMTFLAGGLVGALIAYLFAHSIAAGVMFGGAASLTLTTMFAKNKSRQERWILGGAMFVFFVIAFIGYLVYHQ